MFRFYYFVFIAGFVLFTAILPLQSDQRYYSWTYQFATVHPGAWEIEYYHTLSTPDGLNLKGKATSEQQVELEVGMNEWFDFGIYNVFVQDPGGTLKYDEFKLKARIKLAKKDSWFIDPLLYLEYVGKPDFSEHEIETKLILAKDIGNFNFAFNPIAEFSKETSEWEFIPGYAFGASYALNGLLRFGVEFHGDKDGNYIGPVISHGSPDLWINFSPSFKIGNVTAGKPEFFVRLVLGVGK